MTKTYQFYKSQIKEITTLKFSNEIINIANTFCLLVSVFGWRFNREITLYFYGCPPQAICDYFGGQDFYFNIVIRWISFAIIALSFLRDFISLKVSPLNYITLFGTALFSVFFDIKIAAMYLFSAIVYVLLSYRALSQK